MNKESSLYYGNFMKAQQSSFEVTASLSCIDLGHIEEAMQAIHHSNIHSLHYDVVDGLFNACFIFGDQMLKVFRSYTNLDITVHLACLDPMPYIKPMIQNGANYIAIHYESEVDILKAFQWIRSLGAKPVLAFRCDSEVPADFLTYAYEAEWILKLTVQPGFAGQKFHHDALRHIQQMSNQLIDAKLDKVIEVDGNIHAETIAQCVQVGARRFTGGTSGLFNGQHSIDENIELLKNIAQNNRR